MSKSPLSALTRLTRLTTKSYPRPHRTLTTTPYLKMRVPYAPTEAPTEEARPVYTRIAARRHPRPLIPLDLALLHNPPIADGWSSFLGAIRTQSSLPASLRELAISRVAALNNAVHEWDVHAALALKEGVSPAVMQTALSAPPTARRGEAAAEGEGDDSLQGLSEEEKVVLRYTDAMTLAIAVPESLTERLRGVMGDKQVVELTATVAAYNCVSRFLVALDVGECNGRGLKSVEQLVEGSGGH